MKMDRRFAIVLALLGAGCTSASGRSLDPVSVVVAPSAWPTPQTRLPGAPPRIIAVWMNEAALHPGKRWMGKIITSTNVASVELRTESFSFTADRRRFGVFEFSQEILDVIPQYRRRYVLHLIARNTQGEADECLVPITIR
jgi:hypothetical protein